MRLRLRSPRQLAKTLLAATRRDQSEVAEYLEAKPEEWGALADATPGDAADILEQLAEEKAAELLADLGPLEAAGWLGLKHGATTTCRGFRWLWAWVSAPAGPTRATPPLPHASASDLYQANQTQHHRQRVTTAHHATPHTKFIRSFALRVTTAYAPAQ